MTVPSLLLSDFHLMVGRIRRVNRSPFKVFGAIILTEDNEVCTLRSSTNNELFHLLVQMIFRIVLCTCAVISSCDSWLKLDKLMQWN